MARSEVLPIIILTLGFIRYLFYKVKFIRLIDTKINII
jgi:hypothetical protein